MILHAKSTKVAEEAQEPSNTRRPLAESLNLTNQASDAEAQLAEIAANFEASVLCDLAKVQATLGLAFDDPDRRREHCTAVYRSCHDMKGQGTSFGYNLVTEIGSSLCCLLRHREEISARDLELAKLHLCAIEIVLKNKIKGTGGASGRAIAERLKRLVQVE